MPEAPGLEIIKEILTRRVVGRDVTSAHVVKPTVLHSLATEDFVGHITGKRLKDGEPCPRCGNHISQLNANQRIASVASLVCSYAPSTQHR